MRAISLISGGLDSELATRIIMSQGIEVVGLNFKTPFCLCDKKAGCQQEALRVANNLGIEIKIVYLTDDYFEILKNPKYGYGKNLNPCIDCRILMLKHSKKIMNELNASFIVTGEVLGQRPKSQHLNALKIIESETGLEGLIVRPLSAKYLPPTIPEKEGWIDRNKLFDIKGRSRKKQIELAKFFEMKDYPCPSGGCLLTYKEFANKMKDLLKYSKKLTLQDINLLKIGRHFRLSEKFKVIIGRNKEENEKLLNLKKDDYIFLKPLEVKGPVGVGIGEADEKAMSLFASLIAFYSDGNNREVKIENIKTRNIIVASKELVKNQISNLRLG